MYFFYNLTLYLCTPFFFFFYLFRYGPQIFKNLPERLGLRKKDKFGGEEHWLWMHSASIGEVKIAKDITPKLRTLFPERKILISTVTPTGRELAKKENLADRVTYLPLDFKWVIKRTFSFINPEILVLIETELWPNFIRQTKKSGAKIILVNGRISNKSYQRYKIFRPFVREVLSGIDLFAMRETADAERIIALGAPAERVRVTGNMKYDQVWDVGCGKWEVGKLYEEFGFKEDDLIWVCGSTREGEEKIILGVYLEVLKKYPNLKLILAPRHLERIFEIVNLLKTRGISFVRKSQLTLNSSILRPDSVGTAKDGQLSTINCLLWDTHGELMKAYAIATIVFVGGSLVPRGGHNILEPAAIGKPVIFGPYTDDFQEEAEDLVISEGALRVRDDEGLKFQVIRLLDSPEVREKIGANARRTIRIRQGAVERNIELIKKLI